MQRIVSQAFAGIMILIPNVTLAQGQGQGHPNGPPTPTPAQASVAVDCDSGETIGDALQTRAIELTVAFSGTCSETVEIVRDRTILHSDGSGTIDGSLTVRGATNVVLEDFTVSNARGLRVTDSSSARISRVASTDSGLGLGFRIDMSSSAILTDVTALNNVFAGIAAINNSHVQLLGSVVASQSTNTGVFASDSSAIDSRASSLIADDNAYAGVFVQVGASASFSSLSSSNNGVVGLGLVDGGIATVQAGTISGNPYGVELDTGSTAELNGLTVTGGGVAVLGNSSLRARGISVVGTPHPDFGVGLVVQSSHLLIRGGSIDNSLYLAEGGEASFGFTPITLNGGLVCHSSAIAYNGQSCPP